MPDCDYCGETFEDEAAYLDHLAEAHEGELSTIDERRVADRPDDGGDGPPTGVVLGALGLISVLAVAGVVLLGGGGGSGPVGNQTTSGDVTAEGNTIVAFNGTAPDDLETRPLPDRGREDVIGVVAQESDQGNQHVSAQELDYDPSNPPTTGPHTNGAQPPGVYDESPSFGPLVHSLEHGYVVVYYDPDAVTPEARESLRTFVEQHQGTWQGVIVAPHPGEPDAAYELTAWRHRLKMEEYDARAVRAFVAEYIGRGPENPVR